MKLIYDKNYKKEEWEELKMKFKKAEEKEKKDIDNLLNSLKRTLKV